jgi:hypothetical protein
MLDLIHRLRSRPLPVRRRIALATSGAATALVALAWLTASVALGSFSLSTPGQASVAADLGDTFSQARAQTASVIAGVSAPAPAATSAPSSGGLTVVQTKTASSLAQVDPSSRTIIPF